MRDLFIPVIAASLLIPAAGAAQYDIPHGTFSCGGSIRGGGHTIYDTAGQSGADILGGGSYGMKLGFWYIAGLSSTVDVAIASFSCGQSDDIVMLRWEVKADVPFDGYHVFRAEGMGSGFLRITNRMIPASRKIEFSDDSAVPGRSYSYYVSALSDGIETARSTTLSIDLPSKPLTLYQNYPNPFNPSTTIAFFLPEKRAVALEIFDVNGRKVKSLENGVIPAGKYRVEWKGANDRGDPVSSGIYYYRLIAGKDKITRKLVIMR